MAIAASLPVGAYRTLVYNEVEHIDNQLGFYLWISQANDLESYASWINNATINTNGMIEGGHDQTWYLWGYDYVIEPPLLGSTSTITSSVPTWTWATISALTVLMLVFLFATVVLLASRKPPQPPPQRWNPVHSSDMLGDERGTSPLGPS
jgi:hypothetical protein